MSTKEPGGEPPHVAETQALDPFTAKLLAEASKAVCAAIREHKLLGFPIVVWEDGRVRTIPPEEIRLDENDDGA